MTRRLMMCLLGIIAAAGARGGEAGAPAPTPVPVANASFEQGAGGFWISAPARARVDTGDSSDGRQCLAVQAGEGRVDIVQGVAHKTGVLYRVSFDARLERDAAGGAAGADDMPKLTPSFMFQGAKPLVFFQPAGPQKAALEKPAALADAWKTFTYEAGPFPAKAQGQDIGKVMLYLTVAAAKTPAKVLLDNIKVETVPAPAAATEDAKPAAAPAPAVRIELPDPVRLFESVPEVVVRGRPGAGFLRATATDGLGRVVAAAEGAAGAAELKLVLPGPDYYSVKGEIVLDGQAAEQAETSLVVSTPLPADYYETSEPAFGVWGGLTPALRRFAGAKWDRGLYYTHFQKDDYVGAPPTAKALAEREPVKLIRCMNIMHPFKPMVPYTAEELVEQRRKLTQKVISDQGLVDVWETQNEPMVGENFHGTMNDVMDIIRLESEVVRRHNPGVPIAGICINPMSANQYNQYVGYYRNHDVARHIDALMLHPYIPNAQSPDASGYVDILNRLARETAEIAGRPVPLYISEIGYSTKPGGEVSEWQQAAYLARVALLNRQIPALVGCVWHIGLWNEATSRRELDFGLLRGHPPKSPVREPKPSFAAWATMSRMTYDAKFLRELDIGRQVKVMLFDKRGAPLLVAYSLGGDEQALQLSMNADKVAVTELCGKRSEVATDDGILKLTVGEGPVYIVGGNLDDFTGDKFSAAFEPEQIATVAGTPLALKVTLPEALAAGAETVLRAPGTEWGKVAVKGQGRDWEVTLAPDADLPPGRRDLFLRLESGGKSRFIWQKAVEILPPLELTGVKAVPAAPYPKVGFTVKRHDAGVDDAVVEILDADGRTLAIQDVRAGGETVLPVYLTRYGRPATYKARFTAAGRVWTQALPADLAPIAIPFRKNALDANPADWAPALRIEDGAASAHHVPGEFDRPSGDIRLAYDADNLYMSINAKDAVFQTKPGARLWDGDSLQIGLSVPQSHMIRPNNDGIQETAYAEIGVKAGGEGDSSWVWASMNLVNMPLAKPIPGIVNRSSREGDETRYLFALPWKTLNVKPAAGMPLGLSILVNDIDAKGRHWTEWYSGIANGKDPGLYGRAVLLEE